MRLKYQRVLVTGGNGFLGKHVVKALEAKYYTVLVPEKKYDLSFSIPTINLFLSTRPDAVIHLAAKVGGIEANRQAPGEFLNENLAINLFTMNEARICGVQKFVALSSACAYPRICSIPMKEDTMWDGPPESTNFSYAISKRVLMQQACAYRQQYDFNAITLILTNLYGPNDHFNSFHSHVIPALISKFIEAKQTDQSEVIVWGTGQPTRDFLYVEDAADAIIQALENYDGAQPINLGSGQEISIFNVVMMIKELVGYNGAVIFDSTKPDGQPRRVLDTSKAKEFLGWEAKTSLKDGLQNTINSLLAKVI